MAPLEESKGCQTRQQRVTDTTAKGDCVAPEVIREALREVISTSSAPTFRFRYRLRKAKAKTAITAKHTNGPGRSNSGGLLFVRPRGPKAKIWHGVGSGRAARQRRDHAGRRRGLCGAASGVQSQDVPGAGDGRPNTDHRQRAASQKGRWRLLKLVIITALIGRPRRPPAVFPQHFEPFARAGLALTGIAVGLSHFSTGESGTVTVRVSR